MEQAVGKVLLDLRKFCPNTPFILLSALAEGADRLVARKALDFGAKLLVPLPMSQKTYEETFQSPDSITEFRDLLKQAETVFVLSGDGRDDESEIACLKDENAYIVLAKYLIKHSHVLIALWDGVNTYNPGGTGYVVNLRLNRHKESKPMDFVEPVHSGSVYHIVTPRANNHQVKGIAFSYRQKYPRGSYRTLPQNTFRNILHCIESYNNNLRILGSEISELINQSKQDLLPEKQDDDTLGRMPRTLPKPIEPIINKYAVANSLAIYFQEQRKTTIKFMFALALGAVLFFNFFSNLFSYNPWVLGAYPVLLLGSYYIFRFAERHHNFHLDYRALAEGLRVHFYWRLAGLTEDVTDYYLRKQKTELEWIRFAIRGWNLTDGLLSTHEILGSMDICKEVYRGWVIEQYKYFRRAIKRDSLFLRIQDRYILLAVSIGLLSAGISIVSLTIPSIWKLSSNVSSWLNVLIGMAPVIAGVIEGYNDKMAVSRQKRQYHWMKELFYNAKRLMNEAIAENDVHRCRKILKELGKEALGENGDWVIIHRESAPKPVKA